MIRPIAAIAALVLIFGPVLAAEVGLRALIAVGRLPEAPSSSDLADVSIANVLRRGRPDVLVIGTSAVRSAIKPGTLEGLISDAVGGPTHVQTVAQGGLSFAGQRLLVTELAQRGLLPRTVVTGISAVTLEDGAPEGGDWFVRSELGRLWSGCSGQLQLLESLECLLGEHSALWRWRGRPQAVVEAIGRGLPTTIADNGRVLRPNGWLSTNPANAERLSANVARALARMAEGVDPSELAVADFVALVDEVRSHGSELIVIDVPYFPELEEALIERNPGWAAEREAGFALLEEAAGVDVVEVGELGEWAVAAAFRDPRHLSRVGAGAFTRQLWSMPEFRRPVLAALASGER